MDSNPPVTPRRGLTRRFIKFIADLRTPLAPRYEHWESKNFWLRVAGMHIARRGVAIGAGFKCIDGHEENIVIEEFAALGHNVHFWNFDHIRVGRFSTIAADVVVTNGWHDRDTLEPASGPTRIGAGSWIGAGARIVGSITIGDNAIVGAGAVVIGDVPPNSIAVGVPAKVIGTRKLPDRVWHFRGAYFSPIDFELAGPSND
jgi:acetyltransferase-like isoleucine patch superfamily enzyme